jgi:hypothetical protein
MVQGKYHPWKASVKRPSRPVPWRSQWAGRVGPPILCLSSLLKLVDHPVVQQVVSLAARCQIEEPESKEGGKRGERASAISVTQCRVPIWQEVLQQPRLVVVCWLCPVVLADTSTVVMLRP